MNKIFWGNIAYIIGLIIAIEFKVTLWYIGISNLLIGIIYHKQIWRMMKLGSEWYVDWCYSVSGKITDKVFKEKEE